MKGASEAGVGEGAFSLQVFFVTHAMPSAAPSRICRPKPVPERSRFLSTLLDWRDGIDECGERLTCARSSLMK